MSPSGWRVTLYFDRHPVGAALQSRTPKGWRTEATSGDTEGDGYTHYDFRENTSRDEAIDLAMRTTQSPYTLGLLQGLRFPTNEVVTDDAHLEIPE